MQNKVYQYLKSDLYPQIYHRNLQIDQSYTHSTPKNKTFDIQMVYFNQYPSKGNDTNGQIISTKEFSNKLELNTSSPLKLDALIEFKLQLIGVQPTKLESFRQMLGANIQKYYLYFKIDRIVLEANSFVDIYPNYNILQIHRLIYVSASSAIAKFGGTATVILAILGFFSKI